MSEESKSCKEIRELAQKLLLQDEPLADVVDALLYLGSKVLSVMEISKEGVDSIFTSLREVVDIGNMGYAHANGPKDPKDFS